MPYQSTPFPTLVLDTPPEEWEWALPPFDWPHVPPPVKGTPQPCEIESLAGAKVLGEMLNFDLPAGRIIFRAAADRPPGVLSFSRFRRLTVVEPLRAAPRDPGARLERVPLAREERDYTLHWSGTGQVAPATGRTVGHVETAAGLYLFTAVEEELAVQRVFVPRSAYTRCEFGPSAKETAAEVWISDPSALLQAIERQNTMPVLPIGHSILALGLLTQAQLDRALAQPRSDVPLGEALVAAGLISQSDLHTAIAHKMGYPMVDIARFPLDPKVVRMVPKDLAARYHMLPLLSDEGRLIVAVDRPSRVVELRSLRLYVEASIVPVLAPRIQITLALDRLSRDVWLQHVVDPAAGFRPTG